MGWCERVHHVSLWTLFSIFNAKYLIGRRYLQLCLLCHWSRVLSSSFYGAVRGLIFVLRVLCITEKCELLVDWKVDIFTLEKCDSQACGDSHVRAGNQFWHGKWTFCVHLWQTCMWDWKTHCSRSLLQHIQRFNLMCLISRLKHAKVMFCWSRICLEYDSWLLFFADPPDPSFSVNQFGQLDTILRWYLQ